MVKENFGENNEYTVKMQECIRDYANEFVALRMFNNRGGIVNVNEIMKEHKLKTFEEYLTEKAALDNYETLTPEECQNPTVKKKTKELGELVVLFNTEGATMSQERYDELMKKMFEIIDEPVK